jgi:hypothetical protein
MSQTAYGLQQTPQPGTRAEISHSDLVMSFANQDANGPWNIPFGVMVSRKGSNANQCQLPATSGDEMLGISLLAHVYDPGPQGTLDQVDAVGTAPGPGVKVGQLISVLRKGQAWVVVENDSGVIAGAPAYVRYSQNGAGKLQLGAFRSDGDTSHAVAVKARFLTAKVTVPATTPYPGQSAGATASATPAIGASTLAAIVEFDGSVF